MNKQVLKEELIDLRMKLAEAGKQVNKIIGLLPLKWGLPCRVSLNIHKADDELADIAKEMELDKLDLIKPRRVNNAK